MASNLTSFTIRPVKAGVGWRKRYTPTTSELSQIDSQLSAYGVDKNGDTLVGPIVATTVWGSAANISISQVAGGATCTTIGGTVLLGDNDYPLYTTNRNRNVVIPCAEATFSVGVDAWSIDSATYSMFQDPYQAASPLFIPLTKIHNGATVQSVTAYFLNPGIVSVPPLYPTLTMFRQNIYTSTTTTLGTFTFPGPYTAGAIQSMVISSLTNNVIDYGTYRYWVQIVDDTNNIPSAFKNRYSAIKVFYNGIADRRFSQ